MSKTTLRLGLGKSYVCGGVKLLNCFVNDDSQLHPPTQKKTKKTKILNVDIFLIQHMGLGGLWCLTPLLTIFQLYRGS